MGILMGWWQFFPHHLSNRIGTIMVMVTIELIICPNLLLYFNIYIFISVKTGSELWRKPKKWKKSMV